MILSGKFLLGAAAVGMSLMVGLSPALAIGGDDPIPGIDIIVKEDPGSRPINPFSLTGNEVKTLNGLKGAERPTFVLKATAKRIDAGDAFVQSGMKALGDIWCGPCKMINEITVKFPVGEVTYVLELNIHGDDIARPQVLSGQSSRGKVANDKAIADR